MILRRFLLLSSILVFSPSSNAEIVITKFKSGLVCPNSNASAELLFVPNHVCFETDVIKITGQGRCSYDEVTKPCTWYGYEFEYKDANPADLISCVITNDASVDYGNPNEVIASDIERIEYSFMVEPGEGRFFNPEYSLLSFFNEKGHSLNEELVCSANDQVLFSIERKFLYPQRR